MSCSALTFRKALDTNSTATAFTAKTPTTTEPTGTGVFNLLSTSVGVGSGSTVPRHLLLMPFGTDANNETFDMRLWGWSKVTGTTVYVPMLLADLSCTLGDIAATSLGTNHFIVDTITVNDGAAEGPGRSVISPEEELGASALIHVLGCQYVEFDFDLTGAAAANCLWRAVDD